MTLKHVKLICTIFDVNENWLITGVDNSKYLKRLESSISMFDSFIKYLNSLGYSAEFEKTGESESGYYEEHTDDNGSIIGKSWIPDEEYYSITISDGKKKQVFTSEEFQKFQSNVEQLISFEMFKHNSKS